MGPISIGRRGEALTGGAIQTIEAAIIHARRQDADLPVVEDMDRHSVLSGCQMRQVVCR